MKCTSEDDYNIIMSALREQNRIKFSECEKQYIPMPITWLKNERWKDEEIVRSSKPKATGHVYELPEYMKQPQKEPEKATDEEIAECERQIDELRKKMRERDASEGLNVIEPDNDPYADCPFNQFN